MDKEAAVKKVFEDVYVPQFLEKCAAKGVVFKSEDDLQAALATVVMLKNAGATVPQKARPVSIVKQAAADLEAALRAPEAQVDVDLVSALNNL